MSPHRVLRPFFGLLAVLVLISLPRLGPAHASDCNSFPGLCVDEVLTTNGTSRILTITLNGNNANLAADHLNVIVPGQSQREWKLGSVLRLGVQPDGTVTYSAQGCLAGKYGLSSSCQPWHQVTRRFAPVNACQDYTNAAIAAVGGSDSLGCGFGGAGRWDHNAQAHLNACLMFVGDWQSFIKNETNLRANDLAACKARSAASNKPVAENKPIEKPIKTTGKVGSGGGAGPGVAVLSCRGGGSMKVTLSGPTSVFVAFMPATQSANTAPPGPGECAWPDRLAAPNEANRFAFDPTKPNGQQLLQAVKGGTFQLTANPVGTFVMVHSIDNVQVVDSTPLSPGPAGGGTPPVQAQGGSASADQGPLAFGGTCGAPGATATVTIPEPNLTELNVRSRPDGEILGTVPKGAQVTLGGRCGSPTAAGIIKSAEPTGGSAGWCQISQPLAGCVMAKYLDFSGGGGTAAGIVKQRR